MVYTQFSVLLFQLGPIILFLIQTMKLQLSILQTMSLP